MKIAKTQPCTKTVQKVSMDAQKECKDRRFSLFIYSQAGQGVLLLLALVVVVLLFVFEVLVLTDSPLLFGAMIAAGGRRAGRGQEYITTREALRIGLRKGMFKADSDCSIAPSKVVDSTGRRFRVEYTAHRAILREEI